MFGRKVCSIASLTGIDCEVKTVFRSDDNCSYALNNDNTIIKVNEGRDNYLTTLFPSISNPKNIRSGVSKYEGKLIKDGNMIDTSALMGFERNYSVARVYKDIFLVYDTKTKSWVLVRILVP